MITGAVTTSAGLPVNGLWTSDLWRAEWRDAWAGIGWLAGVRLMAEGTAHRFAQAEDDRARVLHLEGQLAALRERR